MSSDSEWDARYAAAAGAGMFSGNVNGTLAVEVTDMTPGRVLDAGCGEGGDAVWLAQNGWSVTGLDVSEVAIERAKARADVAGANVRWLVADVTAAPVSAFDLVSAFYPALKHTSDQTAQRALLAAVAPGGTLLVVGHAPLDREYSRARGFDPDDYVQPTDIKHALDPGGPSSSTSCVRARRRAAQLPVHARPRPARTPWSQPEPGGRAGVAAGPRRLSGLRRRRGADGGRAVRSDCDREDCPHVAISRSRPSGAELSLRALSVQKEAVVQAFSAAGRDLSQRGTQDSNLESRFGDR